MAAAGSSDLRGRQVRVFLLGTEDGIFSATGIQSWRPLYPTPATLHCPGACPVTLCCSHHPLPPAPPHPAPLPQALQPLDAVLGTLSCSHEAVALMDRAVKPALELLRAPGGRAAEQVGVSMWLELPAQWSPLLAGLPSALPVPA